VNQLSQPQNAEPRLSQSEGDFAIKTWRYLRLAMVVLVAGLAVSIVTEWITRDADCFQTSISAYYYTSVHAYFIAALVSIGVCLFCLKGNTEGEDVLLNLAGMFAPVVALVPTPDPGACGVVSGTTKHIHDNVVNNITALLVVGFISLVILAALSSRALPSRPARRGYAVAAAIWIACALVFVFAQDFFVRTAHFATAVPMFLCIVIVVCINAREYRDKGPADSVRNRYLAIAVAMGGSVVVFLVLWALGWRHWVLGIEAALIALFALFWGIQTRELWREGLR
jgi:multisubunit Na+/H+ antiporter MnhB subunit